MGQIAKGLDYVKSIPFVLKICETVSFYLHDFAFFRTRIKKPQSDISLYRLHARSIILYYEFGLYSVYLSLNYNDPANLK